MDEKIDNPTQASEKAAERPAGQSLGIAALITGIVTFVLAAIPCVGMIAIIPGIVAIVLASVGLSQAGRSGAPRGLLIAGLVIAVVASLISFSQIFVAGEIAKKAENKFSGEIETVIRDIRENVLKDLEDASVSIKVESNGEKVEINAETNKGDRVKELEELEEGNVQADDTIK
ncbi:MAG: DUF4190 domain-containing protein [Bacteroidales bacterium]|jgi:hypothetical protein|nr:DUF4190 domain-containing protein [Bacteroidales bacterium]